MLLTKNSTDGVLESSLRINWTAGDRILRLPKLLQPMVILLRNLRLIITWVLDANKTVETDRQLAPALVAGLKYLWQSNVPGDVAVFGVGSGKISTVMAHAISNLSARKLYLLDSFQGFPAVESDIDLQSPFMKNGLWEAGTGFQINKTDLQDACKKFLPADRLRIIPGWYTDSLPEIPTGTKFCAVYIDCKMYKSTLDVLSYILHNRLISPGAMLFFENWNDEQSETGENKAFSELLKKFSVAFSDCGSLGWGGKRLLIHSYSALSQAEELSIRFLTNLPDWEEDARKHFALGLDYIFGAGVKGDIAEFGTCAGRSAAWLAQPLTKWDADYNYHGDERFKPKRLFLFDSFEGLPESDSYADKESPHVKSGVWGPGTQKALSPEELKELCQLFVPSERIVIFKGWYKDTVHTIPPETRFALVHVDCDLYQSTIDVLDNLFAHGLLSEGAVIYFDDWNPNHASPQFGERKAWKEIVEKYAVNYSDWGFYGWGCAKFIVHSYVVPSQIPSGSPILIAQ